MSLCYEYFDKTLMRYEVIQSICIPKVKLKLNIQKVLSAYNFDHVSLNSWKNKTKLGLSGFSYTLSKDQKRNTVINMYILTGHYHK